MRGVVPGWVRMVAMFAGNGYIVGLALKIYMKAACMGIGREDRTFAISTFPARTRL